jgi:hypothetical protein
MPQKSNQWDPNQQAGSPVPQEPDNELEMAEDDEDFEDDDLDEDDEADEESEEEL